MDRVSLLADVRYRVVLDLAFAGESAHSRTEVRFRCTEPGAMTHADLALAALNRVELNGRALPNSSWQHGRLDLPPLEDENLLVVEGEVAIAASRDGLCRFVDEDGQAFLYLHLPARAPETAAQIMCCFVDAGRGAFDLNVVVPAGWSVVSSALPTQRPEPGEGGRWRFLTPLPTEPRPTFAAGPWASVRDVHARPSRREALRQSSIGEMRDAVVAFHGKLLGIDDPYGQLPCVFVPGYGSQGSNGGGIMMCHEAVLDLSVDPAWRGYVLWVLAHEAAHSWFGGLFERERPEDHWLYEGVATYLCHRAMAELAPELSPWARFHLLEEAEAHETDSSADAHAIAGLPSSAPAGATRGMPPLVYGKPAAVLRQLEEVVGRHVVDATLGEFLRLCRGRVANTADFVLTLQDLAGEVDLSAWCADWLYTAGVNTLAFDSTEARIIQLPSRDGRLRTHRIIISAFDVAEDALVARTPMALAIEGTTTDVPPLREAPADLVVLNAPATSYARVRLDEKSRSVLAQHLGSLPLEIRAVCWVSTWEMAKEGVLPEDEFQSLVATYGPLEPDPQVRDLLQKAAAATP